jgi:hypothetical protein
MQKCGSISDDLKWNIIQHSCLPILLYGLDLGAQEAAQARCVALRIIQL